LKNFVEAKNDTLHINRTELNGLLGIVGDDLFGQKKSLNGTYYEDDEDGEGKKKDSYKSPKDFFTDKRRQKTLKKFIDVTVPQEFLDGLTDDLQLLIKKGKAE
jgi:hypothetical protein